MTVAEIREYTERKSREWGVKPYAKNTLLEIRDMLSELEKQNEWIDVRDRLPSEDNTRPTKSSTDVLVCFNDGLITKGYYSYVTDEWITFSSKFKEEPIAWKPLPEPYKESE